MGDFLKVSRDGAIVTATINRPDTRGAITTQQDSADVVDFCEEMQRDHSVRAVVLTGTGSAFSAGGNIKDMQSKAGLFGGSGTTIRQNYREGIQRIPRALYDLEVPVVAAVNGHAVGAGLDLACMCDVRVASEKALFAESFVKLGIIPGDGGAWLLPRLIGMTNASLMTLTGDTINAAKALEYGLVSEVLPPEQVLPRAQEIAASIAANPGHATRMAKRLLREGQDMKLAPLLELSAAYQALAHQTQDHAEAVDAFIEKRPPNFKDQ